MRFIASLIVFSALAFAQGSKLTTPSLLLPPSGGGTSLFSPQVDVGGNLGTSLIRWNTVESRTYNARTAAGTPKVTQLTGNGIAGFDVLGDGRFSISTVAGSAVFTGSVGIYDGNLAGNSVTLLVPSGLTTSYGFTLPSVGGVAGCVVSDVSNVLSVDPSCTGGSFFSRTGSGVYLTTNTDYLTSLGAPLTLRGSTTTNGNILVQPGNIAGSASLFVQAPRLDWPGLIVRDASGTTTGNSFELQTFAGSIYFKVIGGTDSGAPGTVVTRDVVPFTGGPYKLGNSTHPYGELWVTDIHCSGVCPGTSPFIDTTPIVYASGDPTKLVALKANLLTTGTQRNLSAQDFDYTIAAINHTQTFTSDQTFNANILTATTGINIGSTVNPFADTFLAQVYTESLRVATAGTSFGSSWALASPGTATLQLKDNAAGTFVTFNVTSVIGLRPRTGKWVSDVSPSADLTYDLGSSIITGGAASTWRKGFIEEVNVNSIFTLSSRLDLHGAASGNGNIVLLPGNVAGAAAVYIASPRLDWPGLIIQDPSGTTTGNSMEFQTGLGAVYAKMIGGTDSGAPGYFGAGGFFCIPSGACNIGFTTNRVSFGFFSTISASTAVFSPIVNTDLINPFSGILTLVGNPSTNGNIILRPGSVAGAASVFIDSQRLDWPGLIIRDKSGTTTSNAMEFQTFGGTIYAKMIAGTDAGAPGYFGAGGFFCVTSGACNIGFTTNRVAFGFFSTVSASTTVNSPAVNVDLINPFSGILTLVGATSTNGNIILRPGAVAGNSSVFIDTQRLDGPGLIIRDKSGTTTGNAIEFKTNAGTVYAKIIAGTDAGAPGYFGAGGFFCLPSGACNIGFTSNRVQTTFGKKFDSSTSSGQGLAVLSTDAFSPAVTIDNTGGGSGLAITANCASCIAFSMNNSNAAGVQAQFGPGGGVGAVNFYVNTGVPGFACNTGDLYFNKGGGVGSTFYVCRGGTWANIA